MCDLIYIFYLADVDGNPKLAGFHKSRCLVTAQTASNKRWMMAENLKDENEIKRKLSGDIQVTFSYKSSFLTIRVKQYFISLNFIMISLQMLGMLLYDVLTGEHHPSSEGYILDLVQDKVARDLIERMINEDTKKRPTVEECLCHPFFWPTER